MDKQALIELLRQKEKELRQKEKELETWAEESGLVRAGQQVVVTIEVVSLPIVKLEVEKARGHKRAQFNDGQISNSEWNQILSLRWGDRTIGPALKKLANSNNTPLTPSELGIVFTRIEGINNRFSSQHLPLRIKKTHYSTDHQNTPVKIFRRVDPNE